MTDPTLKPIRAISGQWDPNLSEVRVDGGLIRALKCGVFQPDLVDGDVYYKIVGASFIDEEAAAGRHIVTVDVIDEHFNRIQGAKATGIAEPIPEVPTGTAAGRRAKAAAAAPETK